MNFVFNRGCQNLVQLPSSAKVVCELSALSILNRMTFVFHGQLIFLSQRQSTECKGKGKKMRFLT